jgi:hypothetical protein
MTDAYRIDLDQESSVGGILLATLRLYRRYPMLFAILALGVIAPYELAVLAITGYGPLNHHNYGGEGISWLLLLLRTAVITPLISALHIHAVTWVGEGRRPRLGAVALRGIQVLPVVAAAEIMATGGIFLGFVALIIPGILLALRWAVVAQAAALEHEGWLAALGSSRRLTHGRYGHVLGLLVVTGVLAFAVGIGARAIPLGSTSGVASVTIGIGVDTVLASFAALTLAMLYFDLRARPEPAPKAPREHPHVRDLD